ncbi:ABC transporter permease subunit [Clostridium hydrogenum]|uniref:ABC transporter permease subunit n=1 Tax=Clostridium hydrogenum TaxID=2855764 RepID=UPI001F344E76|nr:ABC transporter permease subunit [Clostridium hydrogenum]
MKSISKLVKNEFVKLFSEKKFYVILAYIIILTLIVGNNYTNNRYDLTSSSEYFPPHMKFLLKNINAINFLKLFSTDSIFTGTTPFLIIIISFLAIDTFLYDYKSGNAKFTLAAGISKFELTLSKYIYMAITIFTIVCMLFIFGFFIGAIFFGTKNITLSDILNTFVIYLIGCLPLLAFTSIVAVISTTNISKSILTLLSISISILISICDTFSKSKYFSPIGMLGLFNTDAPMSINYSILYCGLISFIYLLATFIIYFIIIEQKDIFV